MNRSFAGRAVAGLAALGMLLSGALPARAQFSPDSCLAAFGESVFSGGTNGVESIVVGDLNADGYPDLVTASIGDDRVTWFENVPDPKVPEGETAIPTFMPHTITTTADGAISVAVADLDGDCTGMEPEPFPCLDVISASANDNKIAWYRNNGHDPPKFEELEISTSALLAQAVFALDMDGDDDIDVLSASFQDSKIAWYENDGQPVPGFTEHVISSSAWGAASVFAIDMDNDDDIDVLSASRLDDKVAWYENIGRAAEGEPLEFTEHVISSADLEPDAPSTTIRATFVVADNLTDDDFPDVVVASSGDGVTMGKISWFKNSGVLPLTFTEQPILETMIGARDVFTADVDGDGAIDVLGAYADTISWFESDGPSPVPTFTQHEISTTALGATSVHAADLNGDTLIDVQSTSTVPGHILSDDKVAWYANAEFAEEIVSQNAQSPESIAITDIDEDGLLDVVYASSVDDTIAWEGNDGGRPLSFSLYTIATDADRALSVFTADLDGSCQGTDPEPAPCTDVISAAPGDGIDGKIVWYQNTPPLNPPAGFEGEQDPPTTFVAHVILEGEADPAPPEGTEPPATSLNAQPMSVFAADLDGIQGDDVIGAIRVAAEGVPDRISWFENDGAVFPAVPGFTEFVISTNVDGPRAVFAADMDADGDIDVLSASTSDNKITLYVNDGLDESQVPPALVFAEVPISTDALGAMSVSAADLFADCSETEPAPCLEVLSASSSDNKIAWYEIVTEDPPAAAPVAPAPDTAGGVEPGPLLAVSTGALDFLNVFVGRIDTETLDPAPATLGLVVRNDGTETLQITSISSGSATFTPSPTEMTLEPGAEQDLVVGFLPPRGATFSGTLEFTSNTVTDPAPTVSLTGVGLEFVEKVLTTQAFFARYVSTGDVNNDGLTDILSVSSGDRTISAFLQQDTDPVTFREEVITDIANNARSALVANLNNDEQGVADVVTAHYFEIAWHEGGITERCNLFDVDNDQRMAGAELSWIWLAFTLGSDAPADEWWFRVDYNEDGIIDGDDVAIAASSGIWTRFVFPDEGVPAGPVCSFSCISQD